MCSIDHAPQPQACLATIRGDQLVHMRTRRKQADELERAWWEEHGQLAAAKGQALESEERSSNWQVILLIGP